MSTNPTGDDPFDLLARMWPGDFPEDVAAQYVKRLAPIDPALLLAAVEHFLETSPSPYRPSIGQLRCRIAEAVCGFPDEATAWRQAREYALWRHQQMVTQGDTYERPQVHGAVVNAVRAAGVEHQGAWTKAWLTERARWVEATAATPGCRTPEALIAATGPALASGEPVLRALPYGGDRG